jgi:hypothetical protein
VSAPRAQRAIPPVTWACEECGEEHHAEAECCVCDGEGGYDAGDIGGVATERYCDCPAGWRERFEGDCWQWVVKAAPSEWAKYKARFGGRQ